MSTIIAVEGVGRCDARCYDAAEAECDCICCGENHGVGREQAMDNAREHNPEWLEKAKAEGKDVSNVELAMDAQCVPLFAFTEGCAEMDDEVWYSGDAQSTAGPQAVIIESGGREPLGMLVHVAKHSPTGMSWGYGGSGPADLARSLLIAVLGDEAKCPDCKGTRKIGWNKVTEQDEPYDEARASDYEPETVGACFCEKGYRDLPYQDFKWEYVAKWGDSWRVSRSEILRWLADHGVEGT